MTFLIIQVIFPTKQPEILPFLTIIEFDRQMKKNVLVGAHKKFERVQHIQKYISDIYSIMSKVLKFTLVVTSLIKSN